MKVSQGSQPLEQQQNLENIRGKQPREHGKTSGKQQGNKFSEGLNRQDVSLFQEQLRSAEGKSVPVHGKGAFQEEGEGSEQGQTDPLDLSHARLLAASDPAEARSISVSNPSELFSSVRQASTEARVDKAMSAIANQIEQAMRTEAMADKSDGRVLSLTLDANRFGLAGLKVMTTQGGLAVVLERVSGDRVAGEVQAAAQGLMSTLQQRFPDRKIRILDRLEQQEIESVDAGSSSMGGLSSIFAGNSTSS
ncbi:hypothetical protein PsAD13_03942 [Pseudovibrio sp. Ad13]|uniref:hypothetical protein n=1 Tax=unclassified Pseudovibrio TaxID=2627060 RepID=UPI0007AE4FD5|nr:MULTISPECIES: hypothetical protein [unclassified Pseudovibrio]KZK81534.1 hypothetical protein PsAD13_03942 [Pseudovibrio sp. Ad13]KZL02106.1 hypothetical protein PsAD5_00055 [Pseudovibrio sp. Ad5]KZL06617.1 hypothetical protein PsAD26_03874 [Pseudovibrio sp. Ad26]